MNCSDWLTLVIVRVMVRVSTPYFLFSPLILYLPCQTQFLVEIKAVLVGPQRLDNFNNCQFKFNRWTNF